MFLAASSIVLGFQKKDTYMQPYILVYFKQLNDWATPNLHAASILSLSIFLNYYLQKPVFYPDHPGHKPATLLGHNCQLSHDGCLSVLHFSGLLFLLPQHGSSAFLPLCLLPGNPKMSPCPVIGCQELYLPIKVNWEQDPSVSYMKTCGFPCNFRNPINIIQAINQIYNRKKTM